MKIKTRHIIFVCIGLLVLYAFNTAFTTFQKTEKSVKVTLLTEETTFPAGNGIQLVFENTPIDTELLLHYGYGTTVIPADSLHKQRFTIPEFIANKKGKVSYALYAQSKILYQSDFFIEANTQTPIHLESYIGPPSIVAGGEDYTMQVVVPSDAYDNTLPDSTAIIVKHQFLDRIQERKIVSNDMMGWTNIFSYDQSGQLLLSSQVGETYSKEHAIKVFPAMPEDFTIAYSRKHKYADGNQVVDFTTSVIRDQYGNIVSDGTMVNFIVKNENGSMLHAQGSTINGQALAKMLHPDHEDSWQVKAYVYGMGESNTISFSFSQVVNDFEVHYTKGNREITIGPLKSFMGQLMPDGAVVKMNIYKDDKKIDTKIETSSKGMVRFLLREGFYKSGSYDLDIRSMGVDKHYKNMILQ